MKENIIRVLIVEDDEDDHFLTCDLLSDVEGTEYETVWISKYSEALDAIQNGDQDVCLIDYRLGEGTGIDLLREAKAKGCRVPIILLTGQGDSEIDLEATKAGAADYLVKGKIEPPLLERSIRFAIAQGRTLDSLRESEKRFRSVLESANDAIVLLDPKGEIMSWNPSAQTIFGYPEAEILGKPISVLFPTSVALQLTKVEDSDSRPSQFSLLPGSRATEINGVRSDGSEFPLEISLSSWQTADGLFYSGIIRDVTERKSLEHQLTHQALHDPLTKLANRVLFRDRVDHAIARAGRTNNPVAVLFIDLDNFKSVNDSLGHPAGDELLIAFTERLKDCLRSADTPARFGGDEFAVLLEDVNHPNDAVVIAERIRNVVLSPFPICGKDVFVGTSIGIATNDLGTETPEDLLRNADVAMYIAKTGGKGRYAIFETSMHDTLVQRARLESDLRMGIYKEEFEVYYQPIIELATGKLMGMEALVRWNHPDRGLLSPAEFISVANETSLILPLGRWILDEACRKTLELQEDSGYGADLSITINITNRQFQDENLVSLVDDSLAMSGLLPHCLILEIPESAMLQNTDATVKKLNALKQIGIRLAIDDFGIGYSSLSYLQSFPVDILKIKKSFTERIADGEAGVAVAKAIITMGDTLKLRTIAEGIENSAQRSELLDLGCEYGQGFHFAGPLDASNIGEFLRDSLLNEAKSIDPFPLASSQPTVDLTNLPC